MIGRETEIKRARHTHTLETESTSTHSQTCCRTLIHELQMARGLHALEPQFLIVVFATIFFFRCHFRNHNFNCLGLIDSAFDQNALLHGKVEEGTTMGEEELFTDLQVGPQPQLPPLNKVLDLISREVHKVDVESSDETQIKKAIEEKLKSKHGTRIITIVRDEGTGLLAYFYDPNTLKDLQKKTTPAEDKERLFPCRTANPPPQPAQQPQHAFHARCFSNRCVSACKTARRGETMGRERMRSAEIGEVRSALQAGGAEA